jgi:hypothetical protein
MRHLAALLVAILVAPISWLLLAFGQDPPGRAFTGALNPTIFVRTAACLLGAGVILGLLATIRLSPLGVVLTGAGYVATHVALLAAPVAVLGLFPRSVSVAALSADPTSPLRTGTALILGVSMLVAAIGLGRRWTRPTVEQTHERSPGARRSGQSPPVPAARPAVARRYPSSPRCLDNRRSYSFGPVEHNSDRWRQNRQSTWPYG